MVVLADNVGILKVFLLGSIQDVLDVSRGIFGFVLDNGDSKGQRPNQDVWDLSVDLSQVVHLIDILLQAI